MPPIEVVSLPAPISPVIVMTIWSSVRRSPRSCARIRSEIMSSPSEARRSFAMLRTHAAISTKASSPACLVASSENEKKPRIVACAS